MKSKKWAIFCAFVGIIGGAFIMVSPVGLLAAGIGANGQMLGYISILLLSTYVVIFCVALKSKLYYKGDDRVSTFVANTFVVAGAIGCIPIIIACYLEFLFLVKESCGWEILFFLEEISSLLFSQQYGSLEFYRLSAVLGMRSA